MQLTRTSPRLCLLAVIALAGCGATTKTVTIGGPPADLLATTAKTITTSSSTSTTAAAKALHISAFRTPTGNIGCAILETYARCDIDRRSWSPPARPSSCSTEVDYGQGIEMGPSGTPHFVCAGDTVNEPGRPALAYGQATRVGAFECLSSATGLTCRRPADGHGFFLSVQSYRIF